MVSMTDKQFVGALDDFEQKIGAAADQEEWNSVLNLEKERAQCICDFFDAPIALEKRPELRFLMERVLQRNALLQEKFKQAQHQLAQLLVTLNRGHKMKRTYQIDL